MGVFGVGALGEISSERGSRCRFPVEAIVPLMRGNEGAIPHGSPIKPEAIRRGCEEPAANDLARRGLRYAKRDASTAFICDGSRGFNRKISGEGIWGEREPGLWNYGSCNTERPRT